MNNSIITIILSLFFAATNVAHAATETCQPPFARQVVDQLIVANIDQAHQILEDWKQAGGNALMQRLVKGMTQAFAGRTYLAQNSWLNTHKYGRAGRDTLRQLIVENPTQKDALNENRRVNKKLQSPEDIRKNSYLFLNAAKELGDIEAINKLENTFNNNPDYWLLMKAETFDVNKQREQALALYKTVSQSKETNPWLQEQRAMYMKSAYQPPQSQITDKQLSLNIPCDKAINL